MDQEPVVPRTEGLDAVRQQIDEVDEALLELLGVRLGLALRAADEKRVKGIALRDLGREAEIARRAADRARARGLDPEIVRDLFWRIIALSHRAVDGAAAGAGE